jgi:hypothetical protein
MIARWKHQDVWPNTPFPQFFVSFETITKLVSGGHQFPHDYASARKNAKFEQGVVKHGRENGYGAPDLCLMQVPPRILIFFPCLIRTGAFVLASL